MSHIAYCSHCNHNLTPEIILLGTFDTRTVNCSNCYALVEITSEVCDVEYEVGTVCEPRLRGKFWNDGKGFHRSRLIAVTDEGFICEDRRTWQHFRSDYDGKSYR